MKMEGKIISRENIKPSSPTPPDKRIYKLSLLDQTTVNTFVPVVLYYPNPENINITDESFISQTTQILKQSLSETLSLFYPLAGRFGDSLTVDCNDQGVPFLVVKFNESLSDFLKNPDPVVCWAHVPAHEFTFDEPGPGSDVAMIQVNYFDCGGIALGVMLSHKVADGATTATFIKAWAAAAAAAITSSPTSFIPNYTASSLLFPQKKSIPKEAHLLFALRKLVKFGKSEMRRYVFDGLAISKLRDQLSLMPSEEQTLERRRRPSRVEAVSAFMWRCFNVANSNKSGGGKDNYPVRYLRYSVNVRRRADPPIPDNSFGNLVWPSIESIVNDQTDSHDMKHLFGKVRNAVTKVDGDLVKRMQGEEGFLGYYKNLEETWNAIPGENADIFTITSWCNFGLYSADFGWGKPTWISKCDAGNSNFADETTIFVNLLSLMDTRDGEGIEAWLIMDQNLFAEFDKIQELTDLASVDPSPLDVVGV